MNQKKIVLSIFSLILANSIPLVGVAFYGWDLNNLLLTYWLEGGIIGLFNVLKMFFLKSNNLPSQKNFFVADKKRAISFFILHFGSFMAVYGLFLFFLIVPFWSFFKNTGENTLPIINLYKILYGLVGLTLSHGFSFVFNFIIGQENQQATLAQLFFQPYPRLLIMHFTIVLGAILSTALGKNSYLIILVVAKTVVDLLLHLKERGKFSKPQEIYSYGDREEKNIVVTNALAGKTFIFHSYLNRDPKVWAVLIIFFLALFFLYFSGKSSSAAIGPFAFFLIVVCWLGMVYLSGKQKKPPM